MSGSNFEPEASRRSAPHQTAPVVPIVFFISAGSFWFATVAGARLRNVRKTPYGSVVISEGEGAAHRLVVAEGQMAIHEPSLELEAAWEERHGKAPTWTAAFLELRPERFFSHAATR